ncbi:MAG: OmpA family protein [Candidatus Nitrospinota bacterium M3_3B_026]
MLKSKLVALSSLFILSLALFPARAAAQVAVDGGSGLFHVQRAKTLGDLGFYGGLFYETSNYDSPAAIDDYEMPVSLTLGLKDSFEFSVSAPWRKYDPEGGDAESGISDGIARAKWNFFYSDRHRLRLSAIGMATLPLGDEDKGLGSGKTNLGAALALDKEYDSVTWSFNVGFMGRQEEDLNDQVLYGAGIEWRPIENLGVIGEVSGFSFTSNERYMDDNTTVTGGVRYYLGDWGSVSAAYGSWGGGSGPSSPNYMYMVGITLGMPAREKPVEKEEAPAPPTPAPEPKPAPKPAPEPAPSPPAPAPEPEVVTIRLDPIHFKFDSAELTDEAKGILRRNGGKVKETPGAQLTIEGNTCWIGPKRYNKNLGLRRAIAAKKFLMSLGIEADNIVILSRGESNPAGDNKTREGRRMNRRVDFIIKVW